MTLSHFFFSLAALCESGQADEAAQMDQSVYHGDSIQPVYGHGARALKALHAPDLTKSQREPDDRDLVVDFGGCAQGAAQGETT